LEIIHGCDIGLTCGPSVFPELHTAIANIALHAQVCISIEAYVTSLGVPCSISRLVDCPPAKWGPCSGENSV
jgi:hypothetical protein